MEKITITPGDQLSAFEKEQINEAVLREFNVGQSPEDEMALRLFFFLKDGEKILAMGALMKTEPVEFNGEIFTLWAFVNVIANQKGVGYGKQVVTSMVEYLHKHDLTGIGFCMPKNRGFYEACGLTINTNETHRFIQHKDGNTFTNQDGQFIFYLDGKDRFMEKVMAYPDIQVNLPALELW